MTRHATLLLTVAFLGAIVVDALFVPHAPPHFPWQHVPGYLGWIGLIACLVVVFAAKLIGKACLQRPEGEDD